MIFFLSPCTLQKCEWNLFLFAARLSVEGTSSSSGADRLLAAEH